MNQFFNKTFFKFFFAFLIIIGIAFGVLVFSTSQEPRPVDNIALPQ